MKVQKTLLAEQLERSNEVSKGLKQVRTVLLTWGSSWGYWHKERACYVANCHKMSQDLFEKRLIAHQEIEEVYGALFTAWTQRFPEAHFVLTVSPVRHWKDGPQENTLSKAHLHVAAHQLAAEHENVSYFPAYELIQDDLRDYRFYERDLLHPNEVAVEYVWEKFKAAYFSPEAMQIANAWEKIRKLQQHRVLDTSKLLEHELRVDKKIKEFQKEYPFVYLQDKIKESIN